MIATIMRFAALWVLFSLVLGGKLWKFPYGAREAVRLSQIPGPSAHH